MSETEMRKTAERAVREAGAFARDNFFRQHTVEMKTPRDVVTEVDVRNEKAIISAIRKEFPGHAIVGEESGTLKGSGYTWFVDPLDGTTNYSVQNPFFDISIGIARDGEPVMAFVYAPMIDELFSAEKGKGAFLNGKRIRVSQESDIAESLLVYCHNNDDESIGRAVKAFSVLKPLAKDLNRMRAGALELAFVGAGRLGAYLSTGLHSWDVAAGALIVKEAGGTVTDFSGKGWSFESRDILASNGRIHEKLVRLLGGIK
jgi:myo-inositol-1(or 4)-monophosphatase